MIIGLSPPVQALLGTLMTWGLTAVGSAVVFFLPNAQRTVLDGSLGFAAGVMTAASFWSLLAPAIEMASESGLYGNNGQFSFLPVAIGFLFGAAFVFAADVLMTKIGVRTVHDVLDPYNSTKKDDDQIYYYEKNSFLYEGNDKLSSSSKSFTTLDLSEIKQRKVERASNRERGLNNTKPQSISYQQWKRILLMIVAITVHNIPEGLAVGVGFGAVGKSLTATFSKAKNLALGIGIQNFPEGMAVSLPLRGSGYSLLSAFWWGQLSGMVEPIAGVLGAVAVDACEPLLPYALSFAAGAMVFVVVDDIIPEAQTGGNGRLASFWCIAGFIIMMVLDVGLG